MYNFDNIDIHDKASDTINAPEDNQKLSEDVNEIQNNKPECTSEDFTNNDSYENTDAADIKKIIFSEQNESLAPPVVVDIKDSVLNDMSLRRKPSILVSDDLITDISMTDYNSENSDNDEYASATEDLDDALSDTGAIVDFREDHALNDPLSPDGTYREPTFFQQYQVKP